MRITIAGYGEMGRSFEHVLSDRADIQVWDRDLETGRETMPLEEAVASANGVILAVPAAPIEEIAQRVASVLPGNAVVFTIAKGVTAEARHPLEILHEQLGRSQVAGIYGPMIGEELMAGKPGFADVAVFADSAWQFAHDLFGGTALHLTRAADPWTAAWSAVAKNIYVPLLGAVDALEMGDNLRGGLFAAVLAEMRELALELGATGHSLQGLSGVGDLFTTAVSPGSHHHTAGRALAMGDNSSVGTSGPNVRGEGFHTLAVLRQRIDLPAAAFPLFALAEALVESPAAFRQALEQWLRDHA